MSVVVDGSVGVLWSYRSEAGLIPVAPPNVEIDGKRIALRPPLQFRTSSNPSAIIREDVYQGQTDGITLSLVVRVAKGSPVLRFRYEISSTSERLLTKTDGQENFHLVNVDVSSSTTEVRLSDFNSMLHSYMPTECTLTDGDFRGSNPCMGPLILWKTERGHAFIAYEHGSQYPDAYLTFTPKANGDNRSITLGSCKGTYLTNTNLQDGFQSVWMLLGQVDGPRSELEQTFRTFIHQFQSVSTESRKPYIFYNTWNHQERIHFWEERPYLEDMIESRILAEIDVAHKLETEVFVLDTGWYEATGDWRTSRERFPSSLKPIKDRLDEYGMKLGLWFGPTTASLSSNLYRRNVKNRLSWKGKLHPTRTIWETEESAEFCLVSSYAKDFAQELIRCAEEFGVRYFKWDAIFQYGCDDPNHEHGNESHTAEERANRYAFCQPLAMVEIVSTLCAAVPDAIVDFDVTEYDRCFGLAFLSVGKYFVLNNGPYLHNYNVPRDKDVRFRNNSLFFYPGVARHCMMREPLVFDKWIPTVLTLAHYLPDDGPTNQNMCAASMVLGHNAHWGDLLSISKSGVEHLGKLLAPYKQIRDDAASVALRRVGQPGTMIETYEKVAPSGKGLMVVFANITMQSPWGKPLELREPLVARVATVSSPSPSVWHTKNVSVHFDDEGHAHLEARFNGCDAAIVYFGVEGAA